jgi:hypothetical protein
MISPRPSFDSSLIKAYMKELLPRTLKSATWPDAKDRHLVKGWIKEIGDRVKDRMTSMSDTVKAY